MLPFSLAPLLALLLLQFLAAETGAAGCPNKATAVFASANGNGLCAKVEEFGWLVCVGQPTVQRLTGLVNIASMAFASTTSCYMRTSNTVSCIGSQDSGAAGQGTGSSSYYEYNFNTALLFPSKVVVKSISGNWEGFCAMFTSGSASCWGADSMGEIGYNGGYYVFGEYEGMGSHLPFVNVGKNLQFKQIVSLQHTNCAILSNDGVKCWGSCLSGVCNSTFADDYTLGYLANNMGDNLPYINLGSHVHAVSLAAGSSHVCAMLNNSMVRCWGDGLSGNLGTCIQNGALLN